MNETQYFDVRAISDFSGEEERIYSGGFDNQLMIIDIESARLTQSEPNNKEMNKYEYISFKNYLIPFNWFIKVTTGGC